jgi:hypothetical protein
MEAPAAAGIDPIAVAGGNSAQYYGPRRPATLPPHFHELCVRIEICGRRHNSAPPGSGEGRDCDSTELHKLLILKRNE